MAVPIAAPCVPNAGMGPAPLINTTLSTKFRTVIAIPSRSGVRASPAARNAPPSMKNISMPDAEHEHRLQERQRLGADGRRRVDDVEQSRREHVPERREDADRQGERGQERLVDGAVHLVVIVRAGGARHQHAHAGEQRADEDDDDKKDLPAHADGGVAGEPDVMADERVIDDPLQTADGVLQDAWAMQSSRPPTRSGPSMIERSNVCRFLPGMGAAAAAGRFEDRLIRRIP